MIRYLVALPIVAYAGAYGYRLMTWNHRYFSPSEFAPVLPFVSDKWIERADECRAMHGAPIYISPVTGSLARWIDEGEDGHGSWHNVVANGATYAGDVFPASPRDGGPMNPAECEAFRETAKRAGFTGIGFYPDTMFRGKRWPMFHLDVRPGDTVATWGRYGGGSVDRPVRYVSLDETMNAYRREYSA